MAKKEQKIITPVELRDMVKEILDPFIKNKEMAFYIGLQIWDFQDPKKDIIYPLSLNLYPDNFFNPKKLMQITDDDRVLLFSSASEFIVSVRSIAQKMATPDEHNVEIGELVFVH